MDKVITEFKFVRVTKESAWEDLLVKEGRESWELAAIVSETDFGMKLVLQRKRVVS